jgi:hypothetical protein
MLQVFNTKKIILHSGIIFFFSFILFLFIYPQIIMITSKLGAIYHYSIKNIIITQNDFSQKNSYIYPESKIAVYKDKYEKKFMPLELFMQTKNSNGFEDFSLKKGEIALSKNAAQKYKLKTGDVLFAYIAYSSVLQPYTVKLIFAPYYGIVSDYLNNNGIGVVGYDNDFETRLDVSYIIFSEAHLEDIPQSIISSSKKLPKIDKMQQILIFYLFFYFIMISVVISVIHIIVSRLLDEKHRLTVFQLFRSGVSQKETLTLIIHLGIGLFFIPMTLGYLLSVILVGHYSTASSVILSLLLCVLISLFWILRTRWTCFKQTKFKIERSEK